jgi:dephospho-CoA kinase
MKRQRQSKKRIVIGITGSFGSGKTTVAKILKSFGAEVIDADRIAHSIIQPQRNTYKKIIKLFGRGILKNNKTVNRHKIAEIVFRDKILLKKFNNIMHPEIIRIMKNKVRTLGGRVIALDAPLLLEAGLKKMVDKLIVVKIGRKTQIGRLLKKTSLEKPSILKRIKAQMPLENKVRLADFVIDNSSSVKNMKKQLKRVWAQF